MLNAARHNSTMITIIGIIINALVMMKNLQNLQQGGITLEIVSDWNDGIKTFDDATSLCMKKLFLTQYIIFRFSCR